MADKKKKSISREQATSMAILALAYTGITFMLAGLVGVIVGITIFLFNFFAWAAFLFIGVIVVTVAWLLSLFLETE